MENILIVEDDANLAFGIEFTLKNEGFNVINTNGIKMAEDSLKNNNFDMILLDVMLKDGNGYDFCRNIRKASDVPIIFLTACDEEVNVVAGLDMGADDYITKPFRIKELISRINAVLRRKNRGKAEDILLSGDIKVDIKQRKVFKCDSEIFLTATEYRLLLNLMQHEKEVMSRNKILDGLWDAEGEFVDDNTLSVYIRRLREKIEKDPAKPRYIITVRGLGYKWACNLKGDVS